jgi:hypothetical protein
MNIDLDKLLCEKYPKMMVNRNKPMQETCMCWGFDCGDGWFNILDQLMGNIQHHIDWKNGQRARAIAHNQAIIDAQRIPADWTKFNQIYHDPSAWNKELRQKIIDHKAELRDVPAECPQVTLDQVKEKFGTLRFYYTGGDDYISGMVTLAESMTGVTCESCGNTGKLRGGGWVHTYCQPCEDKRNASINER